MKKLFSAVVGLFCLSMSVFAVGAARSWSYGASDLSSVNCIQDYIDRLYVGTAGYIVIYNSDGWFSKVPVSGDVTISESGVFAVIGISSLPLAGNKIFIGNASGKAAAQTVGGDANLNSNGVLIVTNSTNIILMPAKVLVGNATSNATAKTISGDITLDTNAVATIGTGAITGSEITLEPAKILLGNATSNATAKTISGDITFDTNGVVTAQGLSQNIVVYGEGNTNFNFFVTNGLIKAFTVTGP